MWCVWAQGWKVMGRDGVGMQWMDLECDGMVGYSLR